MTTERKNEREKNLEKKHKQKQTNTQSIVPIMEHHIFKTSWTGENAQFVWQKKKKSIPNFNLYISSKSEKR